MKHRHNIWNVVLHVIKDHIFFFIGLFITVIGTIVAGILPPLVLERIVNNLAEGIDSGISYIALYVGILAVAGVFDSLKECMITIAGQKITHGLRSEMCRKLVRLPAAYFSKNESGVITARFINDVDAVDSLFTSGIISMVADSCKVISVLMIIFAKSKGLGLLMLLVTPILFAMTLFVQKRMLAAQLKNRAAIANADNHVPETIENIRMIHTFRKEGFMKKRYREYINESFHAVEKSNFYDAIYSPVIITISAAVVAVMMVCAAQGGVWQQFFGMSVGTAVAIISYVSKVFEPLESIGMEIQNIQSAAAGIKRINEFLNEEERFIPAEKEQYIAKKETAISFHNVRFGYSAGQEVIHGYSFEVPDGQTLTLTGRTGIGKSTIFKLILGMYEPWEGTVCLYGVPVKEIPDHIRAELIGYVEQSFHIVLGSVQDQITLKNPDITEQQVEDALRITGMKPLIDGLDKGMKTPFDKAMFSQGQLQLLSIARAIVTNPKILLLDEITANLDSATEERILEAIRNASQNRTVLSISHRVVKKVEGARQITIS